MLSVDSFSVDRSRYDGLRWRCRSCSSKRTREIYAALSPGEKSARASKSQEWRDRNPDRIKGRGKRYYRANREKHNARNRFRNTGVTQEQYDAAFALQRGCCAICKKPRTEQKRSLAADHCHASGVFRGLLCDNCNHGLGKLKDSPDLMLVAIEYLERWRDATAGGEK
jgi:hypothetical protein